MRPHRSSPGNRGSMRTVMTCVLSLAFCACGSSAPAAGDVDDTSLGLGGPNSGKNTLPATVSCDDDDDDDGPATAAHAGDETQGSLTPIRTVMTCFDPGQPPEPARAGEPVNGAGGGQIAGPGTMATEAVPVSSGAASAEPATGSVIVVVEREGGSVACGCGVTRAVHAAPADPEAPPAGSPGPGTAASGSSMTAPGPGTIASGSSTAAPAPGTATTAAGAAASGTQTAPAGGEARPAERATRPAIEPPSCEELSDQCYADGLDAEVCEALAGCCAGMPPRAGTATTTVTPATASAPAPTTPL